MADNKPSLDTLYASGSGDPKPSLEDLYTGQKKSDLSLLDVPGQALSHLGPSAKRFGASMVQPFIHPVETAQNIGRLGLGVGEKLGIPGTQGYGQYADAVGQFFKERYGGWENIKRTMAEDPVGFAADIATVATGGEAALARLPGVVGKVGEVSGQVAKYTNPLNITKAAPVLGKAASEGLGVITGKGGEAFRGAARATFGGGQGEKAFLQNLRNPNQFAPQIVQKAKSAFAEMYKERSQAYQQSIGIIKARQKPLDFNEIDKSLNDIRDVKRFAGQDVSALVGENEKLPAEAVRDRLERAVAAWKSRPKWPFHTAGGFDALKQFVGEVKDGLPYHTPERLVAEKVYSAIRDTIVKQSPDYAKVMKEYQEASDLLDEIGKTLSLGKKASEDTALRKLLSATRSDVNTNFGRRLSLAEELNRRDKSILPSLYGQALAPYAPGGLARGAAGGVGLYEMAQHGALNPKVLAALLATSPRLWGELVAKAGQGARKAKSATPQEIIDIANKVNPDVLRQLGLGSRVVGGAGAAQ